MSLFILMLVASSAWAKVDYWVWVDEHGVTNYSEHEPRGVKNARHVTTTTPFGERSGNGDDSAGNADGQNSAANTSGSRTGGINPDAVIAKQKAAIQSQIAEIKRRNCEIGKDHLAKLESYEHIRVKGKDGKERLLSPEEHQQAITKAKQVIRDNCSG